MRGYPRALRLLLATVLLLVPLALLYSTTTSDARPVEPTSAMFGLVDGMVTISW